MKKDEFLRELERLLSGISEEERADALAFYRSYFEDAGEANEASVLAELESPQKVAESIIRDLGMVVNVSDTEDAGSTFGAESTGNTGYYNAYTNQGTQGSYTGAQGYTGTQGSYTETQSNYAGAQGSYAGTQSNYGGAQGSYAGNQSSSGENSAGKTAFIIIAAVLTSPIWLTLLLVIASVLLALVCALFGVAIAAVAVMVSLVIVGFVLGGCGIATIASGNPAVGIGLMGGGCIVLALGILAVLLVVWFCGAFLPWAISGIRRMWRKLSNKRKEGMAA